MALAKLKDDVHRALSPSLGSAGGSSGTLQDKGGKSLEFPRVRQLPGVQGLYLPAKKASLNNQ